MIFIRFWIRLLEAYICLKKMNLYFNNDLTKKIQELTKILTYF